MTIPSNLWSWMFLLSSGGLGGCLAACIPSTTQLAGYSENAIKYKKGLGGMEVVVNANIEGVVDADVDPDTQKLTKLHVELKKFDRSGVLGAEGARAIQLETLRRDNYQFQENIVDKINATILGAIDRGMSALMVGRATNDPGMTNAGQSILSQLGPLLQSFGGLGGETGFDMAAILELLERARTPGVGGAPPSTGTPTPAPNPAPPNP